MNSEWDFLSISQNPFHGFRKFIRGILGFKLLSTIHLNLLSTENPFIREELRTMIDGIPPLPILWEIGGPQFVKWVESRSSISPSTTNNGNYTIPFHHSILTLSARPPDRLFSLEDIRSDQLWRHSAAWSTPSRRQGMKMVNRGVFWNWVISEEDIKLNYNLHSSYFWRRLLLNYIAFDESANIILPHYNGS